MNWTVAPLLISSLGLSDPGLPFSGSFQSADGLRLSQWGFVCYYCSWYHLFLGTNFFFKDYPFFFPPSQPPSLISWNQWFLKDPFTFLNSSNSSYDETAKIVNDVSNSENGHHICGNTAVLLRHPPAHIVIGILRLALIGSSQRND